MPHAKREINLFFSFLFAFNCNSSIAQINNSSGSNGYMGKLSYAILFDIIKNKYTDTSKINVGIYELKSSRNTPKYQEELEFLQETEPSMNPVKIMGDETDAAKILNIDSSAIFSALGTNYFINNISGKIDEFDRKKLINQFISTISSEYNNLQMPKKYSFNVTLSQYDFFNESFTIRGSDITKLNLSGSLSDEIFYKIIFASEIKLNGLLKTALESWNITLLFYPDQDWQQFRISPAEAEKLLARYKYSNSSDTRNGKMKMDFKIKKLIKYSSDIYLVELDTTNKEFIF